MTLIVTEVVNRHMRVFVSAVVYRLTRGGGGGQRLLSDIWGFVSGY